MKILIGLHMKMKPSTKDIPQFAELTRQAGDRLPDLFMPPPLFCLADVLLTVSTIQKKSVKKSVKCFLIIINEARDFCIATASEKEIDELNILQATFLAMKRAVDGLKNKADFAIIDGNRMPTLDIPGETLIHGDALCESIAAASILAKVSRDRYMLELAEKYPQYHFEKHKGYGTKLHYEMLDKYGPCEIHRRSFLKKWYEKR